MNIIKKNITIDVDEKKEFEKLKKENDEMYEKLKYTSHGTVSPSYKTYLENQEKRHSEQIASIYAQHS